MAHNILLVFIAGGISCLIAQLLIDLTPLTPARILVVYVSLGVILFATGLYDPMLEYFGCGASLPLTGFGATIGRGVKEAIDRDGAIGILTGGLSASSAGISAALILGFVFSLIFRSKRKKMGKPEKKN